MCAARNAGSKLWSAGGLKINPVAMVTCSVLETERGVVGATSNGRQDRSRA